MEKNWTRVPLETAKRSDACASAFEGDNGAEMWVIGLIDGEGARICKWFGVSIINSNKSED